jgi:branched-chain amino acid transport system permease protein
MDLSQIFLLPLGEIFSATTAAYVLCALGLAMHFGNTGLLNFGQAAFAAVGAYSFAGAYNYLNFGLLGSLVFALVCTAIFAVILGLPTLRLRADYLAIVTIAAAETFRYLMISGEAGAWSGATEGISGFGDQFYALNPIPKGIFNVLGLSLTNRELWADLVSWVIVGIVAVVFITILRSPWGRTLKGIREDEDALRALGKNVFAYKMQSMIIGGLAAALGGICYALSTQTVQPTIYGTNFTFMTWTLLLLGGAATVAGPVVGGIVFFVLFLFVQNLLKGLSAIGWLPFLDNSLVAQVPFIIMGIVLMLLVIFRPQGFFGNKKETQING